MQNSTIIIGGFPRSGNTFLRHNINTLCPEYDIKSHDHSVENIENSKDNIFLMPVRAPEESIASHLALNADYHKYDEDFINEELHKMFDWNISYFKKTIENKNNIIFLDFYKFKDDMDYIKNILSNNSIKIAKNHKTINQIKEKMSVGRYRYFMPRNNQDMLSFFKDKALNFEKYNESLLLYNEIKKYF